MPQARSASCTSPEQSTPRLDFSTPQIGCAQEPLRHRDEIAFHGGHGSEVERRHIAAGGGDRERLLDARNDQLAAERERFDRRQLDRRAGVDERAQRRHLVGRGRSGCAQRARRQKPDIAVAGELTPGPAVLADLVDRDPLALERFGQKCGLGRGRLAHGRLRGAHLAGLAFDEALRVDDAGEMLGREVGARRREARVQSAAACWRGSRRLRTRHQRPRDSAPQQRNEFASLHPVEWHRLRRAAADGVRGTRSGIRSSWRAAPSAHTACTSPTPESSPAHPTAARRSR